MARLDRVVFFSKHDMAGSYMLQKAESLLDVPKDLNGIDINSLFEYYHISKYFENELFLNHWTAERKTKYIEVVRLALEGARAYFIRLKPADLIGEISKLEFHNQEVFWELFRYFELYKKTDQDVFSQILSVYPHHIRHVLKFKQLVDYYNLEIRLFLLDYSESAELLLSHYEEKRSGDDDEYVFPKCLSDADKHSIITNYIDSPEPNLNYIELIRTSKHLKLTSKILLKAKQKAEALQDKYFSEENSTKISVGAGLDMSQVEPVIFNNEGTDTNAIYGGVYLESLVSDIDFVNIFQDLFTYTDNEGLITLINKDSEMDGLEKAFIHSKNEYHTGIAFSHKNMLSLAQLGIISHYLEKKSRSIENVIQGFVQHFFEEAFQLSGLAFNMPDHKANPSDKIRLLAPELEYLLKQYKSYVTDGCIDHELLQIDSTPIFYSEIPSVMDRKYVYSSHQIVLKLQYCFFASRGLVKSHRKPKQEKNLFQILITERVMQSALEDHELNYFTHLVQEGFLQLDETGEYKMVDPVFVFIAGKLWEYGSVSYWHYPLSIRKEMDRLIAEGMLESTNNLFTQQEVSYFNYYLNRKEFSNGLDLRNKYLHGSNNRTEEHQGTDYLYFLRTLILVLLKLKDDVEMKLKFQNGDN